VWPLAGRAVRIVARRALAGGGTWMDADSLVNEAVQRFSARDFRQAEEMLRAALDRDPAHLHAISNLGQVHILKKDYDGAAAYFERALELDPGFVQAAFGLAKVLLARHDFDDALKALQGVRHAVAPADQPEFYHLVGLVFVGKRDWDTAVNFLEKYAAGRPRQMEPLITVYQTLLNAGDSSRGMDVLERITEQFPDRAAPWVWIRLLTEVREREEPHRLAGICRRLTSGNVRRMPVLNLAAETCIRFGLYAYAAWCARAAVDHRGGFDRSQYASLGQAERFL
jgi:tetratricopeptide (TPR) repeat protein